MDSTELIASFNLVCYGVLQGMNGYKLKPTQRNIALGSKKESEWSSSGPPLPVESSVTLPSPGHCVWQLPSEHSS